MDSTMVLFAIPSSRIDGLMDSGRSSKSGIDLSMRKDTSRWSLATNAMVP
jgi:hypothetical protein